MQVVSYTVKLWFEIVYLQHTVVAPPISNSQPARALS